MHVLYYCTGRESNSNSPSAASGNCPMVLEDFIGAVNDHKPIKPCVVSDIIFLNTSGSVHPGQHTCMYRARRMYMYM